MISVVLRLAVLRYQWVRFVLSGGTAMLVNLSTLVLCVHILGLHYLVSSVISFLCAFGTSFVLQKFWTFENRSLEVVHRQAFLALSVAGTNLLINTGLMYMLVSIFGVHYILAQIIASGLIAGETFLLFRYVIFKEH